ncbi:hypothetical protein IFM89_027697 [Coptis chinensis]|uniref:Uncharacterized protein n=1 Tax=Coptis chinensis TaxID=261450 RepID=A0A835LSL6_9MAGN|nr:hypothetical protein IFM89_027697 [Coptis chinensis]
MQLLISFSAEDVRNQAATSTERLKEGCSGFTYLFIVYPFILYVVVQSDASDCVIRNLDTTRGAKAIDASLSQKNRPSDAKKAVY